MTTFRDWFEERYPDCHGFTRETHVHVWFAKAGEGMDVAMLRLADGLSEYLAEREGYVDPRLLGGDAARGGR